MQQRNNNNNRRPNNNQRPKIKKVNPKNADPMGTPTSMQRHAMHIFKDIAFGRWDFGVESDIFKIPAFIDNAMIAVYNELGAAMVHVQAIQTAYANCQDPVVVNTLRADIKKQNAYQLIYNTLIQIKTYGDPSFILVLVNRLPEFKYDL